MKQTKEENRPWRPCTNEGCTRPAQPGRALCDTCDLEWGLYRRDLRATAASPAPRP